jgi:hypothetical protein
MHGDGLDIDLEKDWPDSFFRSVSAPTENVHVGNPMDLFEKIGIGTALYFARIRCECRTFQIRWWIVSQMLDVGVSYGDLCGIDVEKVLAKLVEDRRSEEPQFLKTSLRNWAEERMARAVDARST